MDLPTKWYTQCYSELESMSITISTRIRSLLDSLTNIATSTFHRIQDSAYRRGYFDSRRGATEHASAMKSASEIRMWLELSQIHYPDAVELVWRLAPRLVQQNIAATTIQLWQRRTLLARYLAFETR